MPDMPGGGRTKTSLTRSNGTRIAINKYMTIEETIFSLFLKGHTEQALAELQTFNKSELLALMEVLERLLEDVGTVWAQKYWSQK